MSSDPQFLSPMLWEMLASIPPGRPDNWRECERYSELAKMERELNQVLIELDFMNLVLTFDITQCELQLTGSLSLLILPA